MTPATVTPREKWLALGVAAVVLLLAYAALIHPWWTVPMHEADARIVQLQERDARLRAQIAQAPEVQRRLAQAQQQLATQPGFLPEPSRELASAGLVQRLEAVVNQASPGHRSCVINNRSPLPEPGNDAFARVAVQVRLQCGAPELATVMHALEAGTPRLFVENLNVVAQRFFFAGAPEGSGNTGSGLDVSFDLVGYLRPAEADAAGGPQGAAPMPMPAMPPPSGGPGAP